ncbi:MAG: zf-HC2 domain-containing protein [Candidatus Brocadiae bacterium]|nr:zf-HC2 domain-containing protein [Candidatus Brocadiia bacterium]
MICREAQENFILYLYRELDAKTQGLLLEHVQECQSCQKELSAMSMVGNMLSLSSPEIWRKEKKAKVFFVKPVAWAAVLLLGFTSGWSANAWFPRSSEKEKALHILSQNQRYRLSLSEEQKKITHIMEKTIAVSCGLSHQIEYIHKIEEKMSKEDWKGMLQQKREFMEKYPESPLHLPLNANLAHCLAKAGQYKEAKEIYQILLEQVYLSHEERGKYLWQMAQCLEKTGEIEKYYACLERLQDKDFYDAYHSKALILLADEDFFKGRFASARTRYQKYLETQEQDSEVQKKIQWIDYHEKDDFYPLILFVQASQKGLEYHYGLKIILEDYPESPLAFAACEMYLKGQKPQFHGEMVSFPEKKASDSFIAYLDSISQAYEVQEIAFFIDYWKASLLEQSGKQKLALEVYKRIQDAPSSSRISSLAGQAIDRIQKKHTKQRNDL